LAAEWATTWKANSQQRIANSFVLLDVFSCYVLLAARYSLR